MKAFQYVIRDQVGVHARPAALLVKEAQKYESSIRLIKGEKSAAATKLMAVMGLGIKCGDTIEIQAEGADEDRACWEMKEFFENNL